LTFGYLYDNLFTKFRSMVMDAETIKELRAKSKMTRQTFAEKIGVSISTVARWEKGDGKPSPLALDRLNQMKEELDNAGKT
jgi:putative transcriptional regulator